MKDNIAKFEILRKNIETERNSFNFINKVMNTTKKREKKLSMGVVSPVLKTINLLLVLNKEMDESFNKIDIILKQAIKNEKIIIKHENHVNDLISKGASQKKFKKAEKEVILLSQTVSLEKEEIKKIMGILEATEEIRKKESEMIFINGGRYSKNYTFDRKTKGKFEYYLIQQDTFIRSLKIYFNRILKLCEEHSVTLKEIYKRVMKGIGERETLVEFYINELRTNISKTKYHTQNIFKHMNKLVNDLKIVKPELEKEYQILMINYGIAEKDEINNLKLSSKKMNAWLTDFFSSKKYTMIESFKVNQIYKIIANHEIKKLELLKDAIDHHYDYKRLLEDARILNQECNNILKELYNINLTEKQVETLSIILTQMNQLQKTFKIIKKEELDKQKTLSTGGNLNYSYKLNRQQIFLARSLINILKKIKIAELRKIKDSHVFRHIGNIETIKRGLVNLEKMLLATASVIQSIRVKLREDMYNLNKDILQLQDDVTNSIADIYKLMGEEEKVVGEEKKVKKELKEAI